MSSMFYCITSEKRVNSRILSEISGVFGGSEKEIYPGGREKTVLCTWQAEGNAGEIVDRFCNNEYQYSSWVRLTVGACSCGKPRAVGRTE